MNKKTSPLEAIWILITISLNTILLNTPKLIIQTTGTGAIANLIFVGIIVFIFILLFNKLYKKFPTWDILDISNYLGGKILKNIIGFIYIILLLFAICISLANMYNILQTIYFTESPIFFILLFFVLGTLICNLFGNGAVKKSACIYLPIVLMMFIIVLKSKITGFSLVKITPFFGYSFNNTFLNGFSNIFIFTNTIIYFLALPFLENNKHFSKVTIISFIITFILNLLILITLLSTFPLENITGDINSLYILTRSIELSDFLQRSDGIFLFVWILSFFSYISVLMYLITAIFKKIFNLENEKMLAYPFSSFLFGISYFLIIKRFFKDEDFQIFKNVYNIVVYVISFFVLLFAYLKKRKK